MKLKIKLLALTLGLTSTLVSYASAQEASQSPFSIPEKIATVNGKEISKQDFKEFLDFLKLQGVPAPTSEAELKPIVDDYVQTFVLSEVAKKTGLDKSPDFALQSKVIGSSLLAQMYFKSRVDAIKVTDQELKDEYEKQMAKASPKEYSASHILVASEEEAKDLIKKINSNGSKFEDIAKEKSSDPGSATQGGSLGWFSDGTMVPEFEGAIKTLKKGEMTKEPVKSQFGYHIIRLDDTREKEVNKPKFEEVKGALENIIKSMKARDLIEDIKKENKVEILIK